MADLLPYVLERNAQVARLAAEQRALPEPELPPAKGVAAVRVFLETFVPGGPDAGAAYRALARRAVTELARVLDCGPEQAEDQLYSMVNQLSQLRLQVPWFTERDGRGRRPWRSCCAMSDCASRWPARRHSCAGSGTGRPSSG